MSQMPSLFRPVPSAQARSPATSPPGPIDPVATAAAIILSGQRRRSEAPDAPQPPQQAPGPIADPVALGKAICAAAAKARSRS